MDTAQQNLFTRDDTFLGICQGLGEDLHINPDLFRVAMIPALFFFPLQTIAAYFGAGVLVLFSRLLFPKHGRKARKTKNATTTGAAEHVTQPAAANEGEMELAA